MTRRAARLWIVGLGLLASGCGSDAGAQGGERERPPAPVSVASPTDGALEVERTYLGIVRSLARSELAAGADGEVLEVSVREGDRVERGQVLIRVDPGLARADVRAARAALQTTAQRQQQAAREAERFNRAGSRVVSGLEIERASTEAEVLAAERQNTRASLARARASLSRHQVVAPFDGVIAARHVDPGDWVSPGTTALELVVDDRTEVLVRVEPAMLDDLSPGFEAQLSREEHRATATVQGVVRALDEVTRTAQVRLAADAAPWLLPGSTVDVRFVIQHEGDGLLIPRDALVEGVTATRVVRVVDGRAHPLDVEVVERGRDSIRVRADELSADDVLVTRGNERLREGQSVEVADE